MIGKLKDNNLEATSSDLSALQHAFAGALAGAAATAVSFKSHIFQQAKLEFGKGKHCRLMSQGLS